MEFLAAWCIGLIRFFRGVADGSGSGVGGSRSGSIGIAPAAASVGACMLWMRAHRLVKMLDPEWEKYLGDGS